MKTEALALPGVMLLHRPVWRDARGFLHEMGREGELASVGIGPLVQTNHSHSVRHVLRGLHFQLRQPQGKLLSVVQGAILDVVADVRPDSPTFGQHVAVPLTQGDGAQLWVPPGYAHGFVVTSDTADVVYAFTTLYAPDDQHGITWDDPTLAIDWGITEPIVSAKDAELPTLDALDASALPGWPS